MGLFAMENHSASPCFFIFGFGYTAKFLARELLELNFNVIGTTRDKNKILNSAQENYKLIDFFENEITPHLSQATHILVCIPPSEKIGDPVLSCFSDLISQNRSHIQWLGYLSSTSVYGDHQGAWVTEESNSMAAEVQGKLRLITENKWKSFARQQEIPLHIFRLAGIYGPQRNAIERIIAGKKASIYKKGQYFSRVHVADIASVILASIKKTSLIQFIMLLMMNRLQPILLMRTLHHYLAVNPYLSYPTKQQSCHQWKSSFMQVIAGFLTLKLKQNLK